MVPPILARVDRNPLVFVSIDKKAEMNQLMLNRFARFLVGYRPPAPGNQSALSSAPLGPRTFRELFLCADQIRSIFVSHLLRLALVELLWLTPYTVSFHFEVVVRIPCDHHEVVERD